MSGAEAPDKTKEDWTTGAGSPVASALSGRVAQPSGVPTTPDYAITSFAPPQAKNSTHKNAKVAIPLKLPPFAGGLLFLLSILPSTDMLQERPWNSLYVKTRERREREREGGKEGVGKVRGA